METCFKMEKTTEIIYKNNSLVSVAAKLNALAHTLCVMWVRELDHL